MTWPIGVAIAPIWITQISESEPSVHKQGVLVLCYYFWLQRDYFFFAKK